MNWSELIIREKELKMALQDHLISKDELEIAWLSHALDKVQQELFDLQEICMREYGSVTSEIVAEMCAP